MSSLKKTFRWEPINEGDIIDIVAPGWQLEHKDFDLALKRLKSWGLQPRYDKSIFGKDYLCSNSAKKRAGFLIKALKAKDSKMVWCMRGGYGSIHLLPFLQKIRQPKVPKLLIGMSDITSLHVFLQKNWQWPSIHGPLLDRLAKQDKNKKYLRETYQLISGQEEEIKFSKLKALNLAAEKNSKTISSSVVGGNLVVAASTIGTPYEIETAGKILFFEEVGERGYRIDRLLYQFEQAGLLKKVKAIVFGHFTHCVEPDGKSKTRVVLKNFAQRQKIPVLMGIESGHDENLRPLPLGTPVKLDLNLKSLVCRSGINTKKGKSHGKLL